MFTHQIIGFARLLWEGLCFNICKVNNKVATPPKIMHVTGSLIRIFLTLAFFYTFKMFLNIENNIVIAFAALLCSFLIYRGSMFIVKKWIVKEPS